jgi:hypothetical protein
MNENDEPVTIQDLVTSFPSLKKAFTKQGKRFGILSLMSSEDRATLAKQGNAYLQATGVDQGNGVITVSLNATNADVEDFYLDSRIANIVNAASSNYDFGIPESAQGDGSLYMAYAVIDTNSDKDNTWIVWGEVDYAGNGWTDVGQYYSETSIDDLPDNDTMRRCVDEISELMGELVEHGGDYDLEDPFEKQRVVLNTLKQKYGA